MIVYVGYRSLLLVADFNDGYLLLLFSFSAIVDNLDFGIYVKKSLIGSHETIPFKDDKCSCCEMAFVKFYTLQPHMGKL